MVTTTEVGQLAGECSLWLDTLRSFRNRFQHHKSALQAVALNQNEHEILLEIEHYDNQFHIQLINIHDLKHEIKRHMQKIAVERTENGKGNISDETLARHEYLYDEYQRLENMLHQLSMDFGKFMEHLGVK